jgi:hypothetical protein
MLFGDVAACHRAACVLCAVHSTEHNTRAVATSIFLHTQPAVLYLTPTTSNQTLHIIGGNNTHIV